MDKSHLSNYIFKMKGSVKEAIRRTYQKTKKNGCKLKELSEKIKNEKKLNKIKNQLDRSKKEEDILKQINPDEIAKIALVILNCNDLINCNELSLEEKVKIRIASSDIVQKMVNKFKEEFPGSESWIDVTIDLLDVKKIMKSYKNKELVKDLDEQMKQRRNMLNIYRIKNKIEENQADELRTEREQEFNKVMKRIKLSNLNDDDKTDNIDSLVNLVPKTKVSNPDNLNGGLNDLKTKPSKDSNSIMDIIKTKLDNKESSDESDTSETIDQAESVENDSKDEEENSDQEVDDEQEEDNEQEDDNEEENEESQNDSQENNESETDEIEVDDEACYDSSDDNCSIDSQQFDSYVDKSVQEEYLKNLEKDDNEDVLIEDYDDENLDDESTDEIEIDKNEDSNNDSNDSSDEASDNDKPTDKLEIEKPVDVEKESEDYLKRQLIKAFGEEIANRKPNQDAASADEWEDDFFINKKVKKFKPTPVDLERYKDLELKEKGGKQENDESDEDNE